MVSDEHSRGGDRASRPFVLRGARVFDGDGFVGRPSVLVDGGRVVATAVVTPSDVDVVDAGGPGDDVTLLPGFVDCHQHLCFDGHGTLEEQVAGVDDAALTERARAAARRALAGGVTTLRDLGDRGWVTLGLRDEPELPAIVAAGPPITRPDGHCWYLGGGCAEGLGALAEAVRERVEHGVDVVKVMVTGGALTEGRYAMWSSQFSADELRVVVDAAHAAGRPVAAHCHGVEGIAAALAAGVDSLEHCTFFTSAGRVEAPVELVGRIAASGIAVSATLGVLPDWTPTPFIRQHLPAIEDTRRQLVAAGATVVVGTDAGINPGKPHDVLPHAHGALLALGLSGVEALRAITSVAAQVCGVAGRTGRLRPGFDADVVAVAGDPSTDPSALTRVVGVWKAGHRVR